MLTDFDIRLEALELQVSKLCTQLNSISEMPKQLPSIMQDQFNLLLSAIDPDNNSQVNYEYIVKMLGALAYTQAEIIENQRQIIKLFGGKNIQMKGISVEEKQRRGEAALNSLCDPLKGVLK